MQRLVSTSDPGEGDGLEPVGPELTVHVADDDAAAAQAAAAAELFRRLERQEKALARGFDELLSLQDLPLHLFPHQRAAVLRVLRDMRGRALLADEVGLGKTIEAGVIAKEYIVRNLARRLLVLAPASLTEQWRDELQEKLALPCRLYSPSIDLQSSDKVIASLDTARRGEHASALQRIPWDVVIVDEAHRLKNRRTLGWRFVDGLQKKYLLLLTATPIQNDLEELYNLMTLLHPGLLKTYREFRREHVAERRRAKRAELLRARIGEAMVRTTRASAGLPFPRRIVRTVSVPLRPEERAFYDDVLAFARDVFARGRRGDGAALTLILLLRELCSSPRAAEGTLRSLAASDRLAPGQRRRAAALAETAESLDDGWSKLEVLATLIEAAGEPAVAFTQFRATQAALARQLARRGMDVKLFHGGMDPDERRGALESFRRNGGVLLSTEAGSEGQNLQFCRLVVNCDLPWNPMRVEQRIGRVHRLGQSRDVVVVNALAPDTMEMHVFRLLQDKIKLFEQVIGELDVVLSGPDGVEAEPGSRFEAELGLAFLGAADDADAARRVEAIGRAASERLERLERVRRLNDGLLPSDGDDPLEGFDAAQGEGDTGGGGSPVAAHGAAGPRPEPMFAAFLHPLSVDPAFAAAALGHSRKTHPLLKPLQRRLERLQFAGGRVREADRRIVHGPRWLFWFLVSYRSDETREAMHVVEVDGLTEETALRDVPQAVIDVHLEGIVSAKDGFAPFGTGGAGRGVSRLAEETAYALRRTYKVAARFIRSYIEGDEGREGLREAEARLARDARRLNRFYEGLEEEAMMPVVQRLRQMERARTRAMWSRHVVAETGPLPPLPDVRREAEREADEIVAALHRERRRRLAELAAKYSVKAEAQLVAWAQMFAPRIRLAYKLMAPMRKEIEFYYDPLTESFVDLECDGCGTPLETVRVAASGDLLCNRCAAPGRASGV